MEIWVLASSVAFLAALTGVGVWHARKVHTGEDFALAGRRLPAGVLVGTLVATWIGTGSLFGHAEFTYRHGLVALALPLAGVAGIALLVLLAGRAREVPADSVPQIIGLRFGRTAQLVGALALIGAYLIIVSYQFRAGAGILQHIFPDMGPWLRGHVVDWLPAATELPDEFWRNALGVLGFALFVILYTLLAGMVSVAWTDVFNGVVMLVGIFVAMGILWLAYSRVDPDALPVVAELQSPVPHISPIEWIGLLLPTFLLVLGDANLYQRFMSARSPQVARRAAFWMLFGVLAVEWAIIVLAFFARQLLPHEPAVHGHAIVALAFSDLLPAWLGVMLVMSGVAVIITTADSFLLGSATSVAADLTGKLTTARRQRWIVLVLGLAAIGLAFASDEFFSVARYAYTLYGATLTPAVVCALVWPRVPGVAIVGGMAAGLLTALVWKAALEFGYLPPLVAQVEPVLPALGAHLLVLGGLIAMRGMNHQSDA